METSRLVSLLEQYANKTIQPDDLVLLRSWFYAASPEEFEQILNECKNISLEFQELLKTPKNFAITLESRLDKLDEADLLKDESEDNKAEHISIDIRPKIHRIHFSKTAWFGYAAGIVFILGVGAYLWNNISKKSSFQQQTSLLADIDAPASIKATITLADGSVISLDSTMNGELASQGKVSIKRLSDGRIVYSGTSQTAIMYNTINVPKGSKIASLILSDGTKVFLNSASSLKYPVAFIGDDRQVEITGEAYFEVAKDAKRKFSVTGNGVTTEVLGTHFNMNTYQDEEFSQITLLEGSIRVAQNDNSVIVKPGDQAIVREGKININNKVDLSRVMAWKEGVFNFQQMDFSSVMRQISRWYDVNVIYPKGIPALEIGGEIQKTLPLSEMLEALGALGVKYEINGKNLTVLP